MSDHRRLTDLALAATSVGSAVALGAMALMAGGFARAQTIDAQGVRSGGMVIDSRGVHGPGVDVSASGVRTSTTTVRTSRRHSVATDVRSGSVRVLENGRSATFDCKGGDAEIVGNENILTLEHCGRLAVQGNGNRITASLAAGGGVSAPGNRNTVRYRGERVSVSNLGSGNRIGRDG